MINMNSLTNDKIFDLSNNIITGFEVYDEGGASGPYSNNSNFTITLKTSVANTHLTMDSSGSVIDTETNFDFLRIVAGDFNTGNMDGFSYFDTISSDINEQASNQIQITFTSDSSVVRPGFKLVFTQTQTTSLSSNIVTDSQVNNNQQVKEKDETKKETDKSKK